MARKIFINSEGFVCDETMSPAIFFRGEHGDANGKLIHSRFEAISFGSVETANLYASSPNNRDDVCLYPRIISATLKITNPILNTPDDPFMDFSVLVSVIGLGSTIKLAEKLADYITNTGVWEDKYCHEYTSVCELLSEKPESINDLYVEAFLILNDNDIVKELKTKGYDGAIHGGYGENSDEVEVKVFDVSQIYPNIGGVKNI